MLKSLHPIAGAISFLIILAFWISTVSVELSGSAERIIEVKRAIPWGFLLLVPALAITGISGFRIAGRSTDPMVVRKRRRMPLIAGNGLLILIPAALYLERLASRGDLGHRFYSVQGVELVAGALNLILIFLNIRDGLRITGKIDGVKQ